MNNFLFAFGLTLFAGLSTGIGSLIALFAKSENKKVLSFSLGFSAGVMIYVSLVEILMEAKDTLSSSLGEKMGSWAAIAAFFGGILVILIIDRLIPEDKNPHEIVTIDNSPQINKGSLLRTGMLTALAVAIHNFPEGMVTFFTAMQQPSLALPIAFAIAIHNIPEGIAVSMPIFFATGNRKKAFWYSFASGLTEPLGALIGYLILMPFMNDVLLGVIFAIVAGIMVFISFDELLPAAIAYNYHHLAIYGTMLGMAVMAVSLIIMI